MSAAYFSFYTVNLRLIEIFLLLVFIHLVLEFSELSTARSDIYH